MYARLVRFQTNPGQHAGAQKVADELVPLVATQPGCISVTMVGDGSEGQYAIVALWNAKEDAIAASQLIRPKLDEHLAGQITGPPDVALLEVMAHATGG